MAHTLHLRTDNVKCSGVCSEDGVQALRLLCRVVGIGVAHLPLLVLGLCETAPTPEVTTGELTTTLGIVGNEGEHIFIIAVTTLGGGTDGKLEAITRITELLHDERLVQTVAYGKMLVNVFLRVLTGYGQMLDKGVGLCPSPVVGPQMHVAIVDILIGTDTGP